MSDEATAKVLHLADDMQREYADVTRVNTDTGELLDSAAAERRAERISLRLDTIADNYAAVMPMIRDAIEKRDDLALGYRSPGEYVADRFGGSLQRLGMEVRRAVVGELTAAGLSTRAIAPVVGVSHVMVKKDRDAGVNPVNTSPEPEFVSATEALAEITQTPVVAEDREAEATTGPAPVVGIDGKTYNRPRSAPVKGRDDAETYLNTLTSLAAKAAREAEKLTPAQIARVTPKADLWTVGLGESVETLQRLLTSLSKEK